MTGRFENSRQAEVLLDTARRELDALVDQISAGHADRNSADTAYRLEVIKAAAAIGQGYASLVGAWRP